MHKFITVYFFIAFGFFGCVEHAEKKAISTEGSQEGMQLTVDYAKGFELEYSADYIKIITKSLPGNVFFRDSIYIPLSDSPNLPASVKTISAADKRYSCQSLTHLAYLNALGLLNRVVGLCGMNYIQNSVYKQVLKENNAREICLAEKMDMEILIGSNSALFFTYPFGENGENHSYKEAIQTLLIAEYLEESQLGRLEWIKLFGVITGEAKLANDYFTQVSTEYLAALKSGERLNKKFIMNLPFGDAWFMPSSNSVGVQLIETAGLTYFYATEKGTENKIRSNEQVWSDGMESDYWVIIADRPQNFGLADLIQEEAVYKAFKSVQNQHVIFCNTGRVDYFAEGVLEPNILLKDLLFATGQLEIHTPKYFFLLE